MSDDPNFATVSSDAPAYTSPIIGNGQIVTTISPNGYHNGPCPEHEAANRQLFWAGRRLNTPTHALVRFGQLNRLLSIDGSPVQDTLWEQTLDYSRGSVFSTLYHGTLNEQTRSLVALTSNVLIFNTRLENRGNQSRHLSFALDYDFDTHVDPRLCFPHMSHLDTRPGYNVQQPANNDLQVRVQPQAEHGSLPIVYQVNEQLGEIRLGWHPVGEVFARSSGARLSHEITLSPGGLVDLWFWVMLSDRRQYTHFPDLAQVRDLVVTHNYAWGDFWNTSRVTLGGSALEGLRQSSLYTIRCNASPWSIPPAYLSTHGEGRTRHEDFYPFLALLSGNHRALAAHVPEFRRRTLPVALNWGGDKGARFPRESLEDGQEGGPYGQGMDERFHVGQIAETAWRYYLYTRDQESLERLYPLLRACAQLFEQDVVERDNKGRLTTRPVIDFEEQAQPQANAIFTLCAAIRTLENAANAAEFLDFDPDLQATWRALATELRDALPVDQTGQHYRIAGDDDLWHITQAGVVFPFAVDVTGDRARQTLTHLQEALRTDRNLTVFSRPGDDGAKNLHRMWAAAVLATAFFLQGRADEGYDLLGRAPASAGPLLAPNERLLTIGSETSEEFPWVDPEVGVSVLSWSTTAAGAVVHAIHSMFVQVDEAGTILLNGCPSTLAQASFAGLMGAYGVLLSGTIANGLPVRLMVRSDRERSWSFRLPERIAPQVTFSDAVWAAGSEAGLARFDCALAAGNTALI